MDSIQDLVSRIRRRRKAPGIGDYVLASRWPDVDPCDPWYVGTVEDVSEGGKYLVAGRWYPVARRITEEEGWRVLQEYPSLETTKPASQDLF